jgi:hypothetical protein
MSMVTPSLAARLASIQRHHREALFADARGVRERAARDREIREAAAAGLTHAAIAKAIGLTRTRVGHIAEPRR